MTKRKKKEKRRRRRMRDKSTESKNSAIIKCYKAGVALPIVVQYEVDRVNISAERKTEEKDKID